MVQVQTMVSAGATLFVLTFVNFSTCPAAGKSSVEKEMQTLIDRMTLLQDIRTTFVFGKPVLENVTENLTDMTFMKHSIQEKYRCVACGYLLASVYYLNWIREMFHSEDRDQDELHRTKPHFLRYVLYESIASKMLATLINMDYPNAQVIDAMWVLKFHVEWLSVNHHKLEFDDNRDLFWTAHDAVTKLLEESVITEKCPPLINEADYEFFREIRAQGKCSADINGLLKPIETYKETLNSRLDHNDKFCKISMDGHGTCLLDNLWFNKTGVTYDHDLATLLKFGMINSTNVWRDIMVNKPDPCTSLSTRLHSVIRSVAQLNHKYVQMLKGIMIAITLKYVMNITSTFKIINKKIQESLKEFTEFFGLREDGDMQPINALMNVHNPPKLFARSISFNTSTLAANVLDVLNNVLLKYNHTMEFEREPKIDNFKKIKNTGHILVEFATEDEIQQYSDSVLEAVVFVRYIKHKFKDYNIKVLKSFANFKYSDVLTRLGTLENKQPRKVILSIGPHLIPPRYLEKNGETSKNLPRW